MTLTRAERRATRRLELLWRRRADAPGPAGELTAAVDYLRGWAAEQMRRGRPDRVRAAAEAVTRIPQHIEGEQDGAR